jgi:hypothetical protein
MPHHPLPYILCHPNIQRPILPARQYIHIIFAHPNIISHYLTNFLPRPAFPPKPTEKPPYKIPRKTTLLSAAFVAKMSAKRTGVNAQ